MDIGRYLVLCLADPAPLNQCGIKPIDFSSCISFIFSNRVLYPLGLCGEESMLDSRSPKTPLSSCQHPVNRAQSLVFSLDTNGATRTEVVSLLAAVLDIVITGVPAPAEKARSLGDVLDTSKTETVSLSRKEATDLSKKVETDELIGGFQSLTGVTSNFLGDGHGFFVLFLGSRNGVVGSPSSSLSVSSRFLPFFNCCKVLTSELCFSREYLARKSQGNLVRPAQFVGDLKNQLLCQIRKLTMLLDGILLDDLSYSH